MNVPNKILSGIVLLLCVTPQTGLSQDLQDEQRLKRFLCSHLDQLLQFKDKPEFHERGFDAGSRFNSWKNRVDEMAAKQPAAADHPIPLPLRSAASELNQLAMDYLRSKGGETRYTRQKLPELKTTIDFAAFLEEKRKWKYMELRIWQDATGEHQVRAKLVRVADNNVTLEKKDGSTITVPITRLSRADQTFVREYLGM